MSLEAIRAAVNAAEHDMGAIGPLVSILHDRMLFGDDFNRAQQNDWSSFTSLLEDLAKRIGEHHSAIYKAVGQLEKAT
jgi:hypothetical protein